MSAQIETFDAATARVIAEQASQALAEARRVGYLFERLVRRRQLSGAAKFQRGKPENDIAANTDGRVELYNASGSTGSFVDVTNPFSITLEATEFVRVENVEGWDRPFAVPDDYTICDELAPDLVAPLVGS